MHNLHHFSGKILMITPPFTQLNTPYPATAYLKGFLKESGVEARQADLSLEVMLRIFSKRGLQLLFDQVRESKEAPTLFISSLLSNSAEYVRTIDQVIAFLQGRNRTLAYAICDGNYLPLNEREVDEEELEWAFGTLGMEDRARHLATIYLEELSRFIQESADEAFGFSRYAEQLGRCASSFDEMAAALAAPHRFTDRFLIEALEDCVGETNPELLLLTVPFPGNLYSALRIAQWFRRNHPSTKIVMGGGFGNTELRQIEEPRFFEWVDYLILDDAEDSLIPFLHHLAGTTKVESLVRTFYLDHQSNQVRYVDQSKHTPCAMAKTGTPDYTDLLLERYLSVIERLNPMHKLWSDGRWNKLTMAHGCYWGKCSFCDGSLDYIKRYAPNDATRIVNQMEQLIEQTGEIGFHFVDEAAPPALVRSIAEEILRRNLKVVWWGNIRFEKSFTADLCTLMKASGCLAVSGGVEVASERILKLINKGVTLEQLATVANHFTQAGILVHAYLMYGFPTQTEQETIDSLEVVRQLFELGIVQSGFWHRFALTAHSPVGINPELFEVKVTEAPFGGFARNDLQFEDPTGGNHDKFGEGLRVSLYNYMNGTGFDLPLNRWFDQKVPRTSLPPNFVDRMINPKGKKR